MSDQDIQWTRIVELELVPHPDQPRPEITEMDFDMKDGLIRMRVRAAVAGYILLRWSVDCSPDHRLKEEQYRPCLSDPLALYGVENAKLAPEQSEKDEEKLIRCRRNNNKTKVRSSGSPTSSGTSPTTACAMSMCAASTAT